MISARCPNCAREYQVKDEFAGKKFRCKDCDAAVAVPAGGSARGGGAARGGSSRTGGSESRSSGRSRPAKRSLDDQLDELRRTDADDYDYDYDDADDDEPVLRPQRAPKQSSKKSRSSGSGSGSMPGPVIAFLVIEALAFLKNGICLVLALLNIVAGLLAGGMPFSQVGSAGIWLLAVAGNLYVGIGSFKRTSGARIAGIVLATLGALFFVILMGVGLVTGVGFLAAMSAGGSSGGGLDEAQQAGAVAGFGAGMICVMLPLFVVLSLYVAQIVLLLRPSTVRYYR